MKQLLFILVILIETCLVKAQTGNSLLNAMAFMQKKQYVEAVSEFDKALSENTKTDKIYLNRGICYFKQGDFVKAETDLLPALIQGRNEALIYLAGIQSETGNLQKAVAYVHELLEKNPSVTLKGLSKNQIISRLTGTAEWNEFASNYKPGALSETIESVNYLLNTGKTAEAKTEVQKSLVRFPQSIDLAILSAEIYAKEYNFPLAQYEISKAITTAPNNSRLKLIFANYAEINGSLALAIEKLNEVKKNEPEIFEVYLQLASAYLKLGKPVEAKKETESYLSFFLTETDASFLDARASYETGNYTASLKSMNILMDGSRPILPEWYKLRGKTYYEAGVFANSAADLSMCLDLTPNDAEANYYLGLAQLKLNNKPTACFYLNRAYRFGEKRAFNFIAENCE